MDASLPPSDDRRELDELRRRAYGRHPDVPIDRAALARLMALEASRTASESDSADTEPAAVAARAADADGITSDADPPDAAVTVSPGSGSGRDSPRTRWRRLTGTPARRSWLAAGALLGVLALVNAAVGLVGPHPDATLHRVETEADSLVITLLGFLGPDAERSSIRGYESYRGFQPWFSREKNGLQCFMIVKRSTRSVDGATCVPRGVDLFAEVGAWPVVDLGLGDDLPDGSIVRFHYRGESVDVFVYPASEVD